MQYLLELIEYEKYQDLGSRLLGDDFSLLVFNAQGKKLWGQGCDGDSEQKILGSELRKINSTSDVSNNIYSVDCNVIKFSVFPLIIEDELISFLVFHPIENKRDDSDCDVDAAISTLESYMVNEYKMIRDLHSISEELTDRYEELNLVYDDDHELESKNSVVDFQLLADACIHYLAVNYAVVTLPEKDVIRTATQLDQEFIGELAVLNASSLIYDWVKENGRPLVVNQTEDDGLELCSRLDPLYCYVASPIFSSKGKVIGMILLINHISAKKFSNSDKNLCAVMARRAGKIAQTQYDDLTGILKRSKLESKIEFAIEKVLPIDKHCCLIGVNIQRMHVINENYGIESGDQIIYEVSQRIHSELRSQDVLGRIGGDVFGVLARHCDSESALILARKLLDAVIKKPFILGDISVSISAVVSIVPMRLQDSASHILTCLNSSLDVASARGGDCVELYTHENMEIAKREEDIYWVSKIQNALVEDRFELYCQGVYDIENLDNPEHYEILLRLRDDDGTIISPGVFLPAAKRYRLMSKVDSWVVENTIKYLSSLGDDIRSKDISWAINLSGQTLSSSDFPANLANWLNQYSLPAKCLGFEITEGETIDHIEKAKNCIEQLRNLGCRTYLDDFGTGLSSFSYMQTLTFDVVKIDGCFIRNIEADSVSRSMVSAICMVASEIGLNVVAEYVEDLSVAPLLDSLGVSHLQGYGLHEPQSISEVVTQLPLRKAS